MKLSGAIFDLDGTLIDSMQIWDNVSYNYLVEQGVTPKPDLKDMVAKMYLKQSAEYVVSEYGLSQSPETVTAAFKAIVTDFYTNDVQPKAGVVEFLERLKKAGVKMTIATANEPTLAEAALKCSGLAKYFERIFTCAEVGISKESPLVFDKAAEFLGTPKDETVIFEDSLHAIITAAENGYKSAAVYDKMSEKNTEAIKALASFYEKEILDLCSYFDNI